MHSKLSLNTFTNPKMTLQHARADKELAAHYMIQRIPIVRDNWNIAQIHQYLHDNKQFESTNYVYVLDGHEKLVGVVSLHEIFEHRDTSIRKLMHREIIAVTPDTHIERVAKLALEHNLRAIPVVKRGTLAGVIETQKILSILNRALREHVMSFGGVHKGHLDYDDIMKMPLFTSITHRLPWLLIGLLGVIVAAAAIDRFAAVLNAHIILAFFIPAIVYMSGALGAQNQTLFVRDLALMGSELKIPQYFFRTTAISFSMSLVIGALVFALTTLIWHNTRVALVIAIAMFATLMVSCFTSLLTTLLFKYLKQDPALGSGPFGTIVSDLSSIIIYFVIVSLLL
ncbi:MAG: magnesium transporter [Candidatus Iainarchaeum archaeon]|uniref:Magnesium transporter n=1 Tax=Candidatus Iainarchaeum sp. TaxID=3101447 RepID=A0A7T9DJF7_9ARCH|nr:MAG: magnesium transporter [Candidatus Diapherotrites archaeon]